MVPMVAVRECRSDPTSAHHLIVTCANGHENVRARKSRKRRYNGEQGEDPWPKKIRCTTCKTLKMK